VLSSFRPLTIALLISASALCIPKTQAQCFVDAVCDNVGVSWDHSDWDNEIRSVVRILIDTVNLDTSCSGVLLNNTLNNNELYVLTAFHCLDISPRDGYLTQSEIDRAADFKYYFHYYNEMCGNDASTKTPIELNQNMNAELVAAWGTTDFALIRLHDDFDFCDPQMENHLFWAGWTRSNTPFNSMIDQVIGLHHPTESQGGLPMKVVVYNDDAIIHSADTNFWEVDELWDLGDITDGSSGSPLFNDEHLVTGQLTSGSGYPPCSTGTNPSDYSTYGRFDLSWLGGGTPETQLRPWLCPDCDGVTPDPLSVEGIEYIGGSAVGGIDFSCNDIIYTVKRKPLPVCCWEIEVELQGDACIKGFIVALSNGTTDIQEKIVTDYKTINGKLVFQYCISGDDGFMSQIKVTPLGTNNTTICPTSAFPLDPDLRCDECKCHDAYSVKYRPSGTDDDGQCCYIPVIKKIDSNACDIYGAHADVVGYNGLYSSTPLILNVGDSVELPELCVPHFSGAQLMYMQLYDLLEYHYSEDDPMCNIYAQMDACCSCLANYDMEVINTGNDADECCFKVNATWRGTDEDCKPKSVLLFDDQGVYTGYLSAYIGGIDFVSFQSICIDRDELPKTYELRFYEEFNVDPQDPPEEMCHLDAEFTPCDFNCCSLYNFQTSDYVTYDPISGTSEYCVDLLINQSDTVEGCDIMSMLVTDQFGNEFMAPWVPGSTTMNLCCEPYPGIPSFNMWEITLFGSNGPLINPFTGDTCKQTVFFSCGITGKASIEGNNSQNHSTDSKTEVNYDNSVTYFNAYPNPSDKLVNIEFALEQPALVGLEVRDGKGKLVKVLVNEKVNAGKNAVKFETSDLASGVYYAVLRKNNITHTLPITVSH